MHACRQQELGVLRMPFQPPNAAAGFVGRRRQWGPQVPSVPQPDLLVVAARAKDVLAGGMTLQAAYAHCVRPFVHKDGEIAALPRVPHLHLAVVCPGEQHRGLKTILRHDPRLHVVRPPALLLLRAPLSNLQKAQLSVRGANGEGVQVTATRVTPVQRQRHRPLSHRALAQMPYRVAISRFGFPLDHQDGRLAVCTSYGHHRATASLVSIRSPFYIEHGGGRILRQIGQRVRVGCHFVFSRAIAAVAVISDFEDVNAAGLGL
mmetsp:Transcript_17814/g.31756  ORF Transcript_17814/g.31756 Transcript_17814/m.31756 type:complete len:262 (+) Transcript_17814:515-1300(+)